MADANQEYHRGQVISCPSCGSESIVQVKTRMDGWNNLGDWFVCGLCRHFLSAVSDDRAAPRETETDEATNRLAAFLDTDTVGLACEEVLGTDEDAAFCKDCLHFLRHPFVSRCLLHDRVTEPMRDCEEFARRPDGVEDEEIES